MVSPVAHFAIDGQLYMIIRSEEFAQGSQDGGGGQSKLAFVGEMTIGNRRFVVVKPEKSRSDDGDARAVIGAGTDSLTRRELQIAMLVADGRVNKQIADELCISEWTVSSHLRRIFAKLGVDSRAAMIYRCSKIIERYKKGSLAG